MPSDPADPLWEVADLVRDIDSGLWAGRTFSDIPERFRTGSAGVDPAHVVSPAAVVFAAIRAGLSGAPSSLDEVEALNLTNSELLLKAGVARGWASLVGGFHDESAAAEWSGLPLAVRSSVMIMKEVLQEQESVWPYFNVLRKALERRLQEDDPERASSWPELVPAPAGEDRDVIELAIRGHVWRHWDAVSYDGQPVGSAAIRVSLAGLSWGNLPTRARRSVALVTQAVQSSWKWEREVESPARQDPTVIHGAISAGLIRTWSDIPFIARGSVSILLTLSDSMQTGRLAAAPETSKASWMDLRNSFILELTSMHTSCFIPGSHPANWDTIVPLPARGDLEVLFTAIAHRGEDFFRGTWNLLPLSARGSVHVFKELFAALQTNDEHRTPLQRSLATLYLITSLDLKDPKKSDSARRWAWDPPYVYSPALTDREVVKEALRLGLLREWVQVPNEAKQDEDCIMQALASGVLTGGVVDGAGGWLADGFLPREVALSARVVARAIEAWVLTKWTDVPETLRGNSAVAMEFAKLQSPHLGFVHGNGLPTDVAFSFFRDVRLPAVSDPDVIAKAIESHAIAPEEWWRYNNATGMLLETERAQARLEPG
eukprot:g9717.t1